MLVQHLSEDDLRETFRRAREIAEQGPAAPAQPELESYLKAAEEMGLPREAMLLALRERAGLPAEGYAEGQMVFARSIDGYYYPGTLIQVSGHSAVVRFVNGGEHPCALVDLRLLALVPGRKVQGDVKGWGWYGCKIVSHDAASGKVKVEHDDWSGEKETMPLGKLRLTEAMASPEKKEKSPGAPAVALKRVALAAGGVGLAAGMILSHLLPWLLPFLR